MYTSERNKYLIELSLLIDNYKRLSKELREKYKDHTWINQNNKDRYDLFINFLDMIISEGEYVLRDMN